MTRFVYLILFSMSASVAADERLALPPLLLHSSFNGTTDVNLFDKDGWIYTADSLAMTKITQGNSIKEVTIAKDAGRFGDCLRFSAKTKQVLFYKATVNGFQPRDNWSGTVGVWLKLDPDKDLPAGFCDPIQITAKKWNDASFFVDFNKDLPRDFRLGVFSDHKFWNPNNTKFDDIPLKKRPMITVRKPPFSRDRWTHVVFTFSNLNPTDGKSSSASMYLNGDLQGTLNQPLRFTWDQSGDNAKEAVIMLGINYVGDLDELAIFQQAMTADQVRQYYRLPNGL
jgi:hypothetical protein